MKHFLAVLFILSSLHTLADEKKFELLIDPGHGGNDIGASKNKIKESYLVLTIAQKIKNIITAKYPAIHTQLTRTENKYIPLADRIHKSTPDLFLSLHANSSVSNQVQGMEAYFQPDQKSNSTNTVEAIIQDLESIGKTNQSLLFSKKLQTEWDFSTSVIRRSAFYVIEKTSFPSVLIEMGFLTNPVEAQKLNTDTYQNTIAETIVKSIVAYVAKDPKSTP